MRRFFATCPFLVLVLTLTQAPFLHVHEQSDPHDHGGPFHSHFDVVDHHDEPSWHAADAGDDAQPIDLKLAKSPKWKLFVLIEQVAIVPTEPKVEYATPAVRPCAHDPPSLCQASPRAPPS